MDLTDDDVQAAIDLLEAPDTRDGDDAVLELLTELENG
ncbi:hypothetical protein SAMN05444149_10112 [Pseudosulfitobacter pseudonitzschiae]|nr:hypothetical protein SAMN05444149_10112 [Pseudosulfitobacter pseudonitzschiae]